MEKGTHNGQQTCYLAPPSGVIKTLQLGIWRPTKEPETSCAHERKKKKTDSGVESDPFSFKPALHKTIFFSNIADNVQELVP